MANPNHTFASLEPLNAPQLRRLLMDQYTRQKLGLYWEASAIERDAALNANTVRLGDQSFPNYIKWL